MASLRGTFCLLALFVLSGCETASPLASYLKRNGFESFTPPRTKDGVGTIVDFKDKTESVVVSPDPPDPRCMTADVVSPSRQVVALPKLEYTLSRDWGVELSLPNSVIEGIDLSGAFSDHRVKTVRIQITDPYDIRITRDSVIRYFASLSQDDRCRTYLLDPENFLINRVLGASGVRYEFADDSGRALKLDAELGAKLKLSPTASQKYVGKEALNIEAPILIGYRAWRVTKAQGLVGEPIRLQDLSASEIARGKSRQ
ncbi:MAG TPA: hypothetical protein VI670_19590 [Thermoanaerobaculia bacterium]|jgi:hypothetical protein